MVSKKKPPGWLRSNIRVARALSEEYLAGEDRGQSGPQGAAMAVVSLVVALTVGAIIAAFLLPVGINELVAVDTSNWSSGAQSLWDILDVIIVVSLFLFFIAVAMHASERV